MRPGLDVHLFSVINRDLSNALFDILMPFITNPQPFVVPFLMIGTGLLIWGGRKGRLAVAAALLLLFTSNGVSELLKLWFERPRPCQVLETVRVLVGCSGGSFSFPSSHAVNVTAQAALFASFYRPLAIPLFGLAGAVGYSRIYVGVHYPADVAVTPEICRRPPSGGRRPITDSRRPRRPMTVHRRPPSSGLLGLSSVIGERLIRIEPHGVLCYGGRRSPRDGAPSRPVGPSGRTPLRVA
jgi:undecaprenyl-diphosphatase